MRKLVLSVLAVLVLFIGTQAQVTFGPKIGLNLANVAGDNTENTKMKMGFQAGLVADIVFSDAISLQPGAMFSQKGTKSEFDFMDETITITTNAYYLEIPINMVYGLDLGGNKLQFFAGPYVGIGLTGKVTSDAEDSEDLDITFVNDETDLYGDDVGLKPIDIGLNVGVGFKIQKIQIQANYGLGLTNIFPDLDGEAPEDKNTNNVIQFSVAYFFGK